MYHIHLAGMAAPPPKCSPNSHKWTSSQASTTLAMWKNTTPEIHKRFRFCFKWKMYAWILWKMKKKKNIYCRGLTLTLSEMGITLYLPHLVSVHARFVLLDNSSIYWRQTITNFFDKQFFFHLTLYSAQLRYFIKRFSRVLQDLHRWHQNLSRKFCKATQTVCLKRKRQLLFAVTHWLLGLFSSTHQLKSQELSLDEFTILSKVG